MKMLMIGGTRFIGAHAAVRFHQAGHEVTVFHRGHNENPILPQVAHVRDPAGAWPITVFPTVLKQDWDVVVHMTAMGKADAQAAVRTFAGRTGRLLLISSLDVYRAYGRLTGAEPGPIEPAPLGEGAPLRSVLYPYRGLEASLGDWARDYDKVLAEAAIQAAPDLDWTILRLPKVYGPEDNADLGTIYGFARAARWRWTHGHVRNVAAAIETAAIHPRARNAVFNVGEASTPTMAERLANLPSRPGSPPEPPPFDFRQPLATDTAKIRRQLAYEDVVDERSAMAALAA